MLKENSSNCTDTMKITKYEKPVLTSTKAPPSNSNYIQVCQNAYFTLPISIDPPKGYTVTKVQWRYTKFVLTAPFIDYPLPSQKDTFFIVPTDTLQIIQQNELFNCLVMNDKGCSTYYHWIVNVFPGGNAGKATDLLICGVNDKTIDLNKQLEGQNPAGKWMSISSTFPKNKFDSKGIINIDSLGFGVYKFAYVVIPWNNLCSDTAYVNVKINPALKIDAGKDQILTCKDATLTLGSAKNIQNQVSKSWKNLDQSASVFPDTALLKINEGGKYVLSIKHKTNGCVLSDTVLVKDQRMKNIFSYEAIPCGAKYGNAKAELSRNGTPPIVYSIDNQAVNSNIFKQIQEGKHKILVSDAGGCRDTFSFVLSKPIDVDINISPQDTTIESGDTLLFKIFTSLTQNNIKAMSWLKDGQLIDKNISFQKSIKSLQNANYQVFIESKEGCKDSTSATVKVTKSIDLFAPTAFSPNNDQNNDVFKLYPNPKKVNKILSFDIFDRWGNHILHQENIDANNPDFGWDGTFRGELLEESVYLWTVEIGFINGTSKKLSGDVSMFK